MACSSCAKRAAERRAQRRKENTVNSNTDGARGDFTIKSVNSPAVVAGASKNPSEKVRIRYYGGGSLQAAGVGCRACGGGKKYVVTTSERIMFASEDVENGLFSQTFTIGHDYFVTEKQAEYLLGLTYQNRAGKIVHKFKKV